MTLCFATQMPDILLYGLLIAAVVAICLPVLFFILKLLILIFFVLLYTVQGRFKEFDYRMTNDPKFLTFDKETGKFIW